jgi:hypothetical protein
VHSQSNHDRAHGKQTFRGELFDLPPWRAQPREFSARGPRARWLYSRTCVGPTRGKAMNMLMKFAAAAALSSLALVSSPIAAQPAPSRAIVSLYHAVPGHQEDLMRWLADQDRIAAAAGVPTSQVYVHTDGDSWDFMVIQPATTEAQDAAIDAAAKKMGMMSGPRVALEFRKHIQNHTDTFVRGPMSAAEYLNSLGPRR